MIAMLGEMWHDFQDMNNVSVYTSVICISRISAFQCKCIRISYGFPCTSRMAGACRRQWIAIPYFRSSRLARWHGELLPATGPSSSPHYLQIVFFSPPLPKRLDLECWAPWEGGHAHCRPAWHFERRRAQAMSTPQQINKTTSQQVSMSTRQQVNKSAGRQANKSVCEQVNKSTRRQVNKLTSQYVNTSTSKQISRSTSQHINKPTSQQVLTTTSSTHMTRQQANKSNKSTSVDLQQHHRYVYDSSGL